MMLDLNYEREIGCSNIFIFIFLKAIGRQNANRMMMGMRELQNSKKNRILFFNRALNLKIMCLKI
jgi:hypothetical protein